MTEPTRAPGPADAARRSAARARASRAAVSAILTAAFLLLALAIGAGGAAAQVLPLSPPSSASGDKKAADPLAPLVEAAEKEGYRVVIVGGPPADGAAAKPPPAALELAGLLETAEDRAEIMFLGAGRDLDRLPARLARLWPGNPVSGPLVALATALAALLVGRLAELGLRRAVVRPRPPVPTEASRGTRYAEILRQLAESLLGVLVMIGVATLVFVLLHGRESPGRIVGEAVILVGGVYLRIGVALARIAVRTEAEPPQIAVFGADDAMRLRRGLYVVAALAATILATGHLLRESGAGDNLVQSVHILSSLVGVGVLVAVIWRNHDAISRATFHHPRGLLAHAWPVAGTLYLVGAVLALSWRSMTGQADGGVLVLGPIYAAVAALVVYALGVIATERMLSPDEPAEQVPTPPPPQGGAEGAPPPPVQPPVAAARRAPADAEHAAEKEPAAPPGASHVDVGRRIAATLAIAVWAGAVFAGWGTPLLNDAGQVHSLWVILAIVTLARAGWVALRAYFDRRIAEERALAAPDDEAADEGGGKGSRLGTLLPLLRTSVLIAVSTLTGMIVLSELGVDIAPLFAGAGLIGFAIGFGAQALVRDIFAGLFFLIDDAFRVGEYVEVGNLRGTVEKISIRSMQLRHHTGPVHTLPFGEIRELTNYSRDWVIMKLPLRVTFDTDPERVRKLVKKLGQELAQDPIHGHKFLQPLKSQGVREIDDSGQVIRVKFMTRPGEQFVLRKLVYAKIRELFEREGIEFARREVRVRVSGGGDLTDEQREEIAGAAAEGALGPVPGGAAAGGDTR